jgi:hypothetical protein
MKFGNYSESFITEFLTKAANRFAGKVRESEKSDASLFGERVAARLGVELDHWQLDFLQIEAKQTLLLASRQIGKSFTTAILSSHQAVYFPNSLTCIISPSLRQSLELHSKIKDVLDVCGVGISRQTELTTVLSNGAKILALPSGQNTIRGFSPNLLILEEAAHLPDETYFAVKPMLLATKGRLIAISSAWFKQGFFHDAYISNDELWEKVTVTAEDVGRIDKQWLENERRSLPEWIFASQYECKFFDSEKRIFSFDDIQAALDDSIKAYSW